MGNGFSTLAIVLAGGKGSRLHELTASICKPAVSFAGTHRIIDWTMANLARSSADRAIVALQYKPRTLARHLTSRWQPLIGRGKLQQIDGTELCGDLVGFQGTADALRRILAATPTDGVERLLVLGADHIYEMNYDDMIAAHVRSGASATLACHRVPRATAHGFGVLTTDADGRVASFHEKPADPPAIQGDPEQSMASMGIYVFELSWLRTALRDHPLALDIGHDIMPIAHEAGELGAFEVSGKSEKPFYWRDVGTLDAYREAQVEFARLRPCALPDGNPWHARASARPDERGNVLMPGASVAPTARLTKVIVAPDARVPDGLIAGESPAEDSEWFRVTPGGTTLITSAMVARRASALNKTYWMGQLGPARTAAAGRRT